MKFYICSPLALAFVLLFLTSSLAAPSPAAPSPAAPSPATATEKACTVGSSSPGIPDTFYISAKTDSVETQYLGVNGSLLSAGAYNPASTLSDPLSWSLLSNGSLTTNSTDTEDPTLLFLWQVVYVPSDYTRIPIARPTAVLFIGSWTNAKNYKLANVNASTVCVEDGGVETQLAIGNEPGESYASLQFSGAIRSCEANQTNTA